MTFFRRPDNIARAWTALVLVGIGCLFFARTLGLFFGSIGRLAQTDLSAWLGGAMFFAALAVGVIASPAATRRTGAVGGLLAVATALLTFAVVEKIPFPMHLLDREEAFSNIVSVGAALAVIVLAMHVLWRATLVAVLNCGGLFALIYFLAARIQVPDAPIPDILAVPAGVLLGISVWSVIFLSRPD